MCPNGKTYDFCDVWPRRTLWSLELWIEPFRGVMQKPPDWLYILPLALAPVTAVEMSKLFRGWIAARRPPQRVIGP